MSVSGAQTVRAGRTDAADHSFPEDHEMSSRHFEIICSDGVSRVRDLKSTNGTFLNGIRVDEANLTDGDLLKAGRTEFRIAIDPARPVPRGTISESAPQVADNQAKQPPAAAPLAADQEIHVLVIINGGRQFGVPRNQRVIVGRTEASDIDVPTDGHLSSRHFSLENTGNSVIVRDERSTNGTFIGDNRISEKLLDESTEILAGQSRFAVKITRPDIAPKVAASPPALAAARGKQIPETVELEAPLTIQSPKQRDAKTDKLPQFEPKARPESAPAKQPESFEPVVASHPPLEIVILEYQRLDSSMAKFWLTPGQMISVGRTAEADEMVADDSELSGRHFTIMATESICRVVDLETTNGTLVNGARVADTALIDGDTITAGSTKFSVRVVGGPDKVERALSVSPAASVRSQPPKSIKRPKLRTGEKSKLGNQPLIVCESFPCGSGLVLYRGSQTTIKPRDVLQKLASGRTVSVFVASQADESQWIPWHDFDQLGMTGQLWAMNRMITFGAAASVANLPLYVEQFRDVLSPGGEPIMSSSAAIADFLANSTGDAVRNVMRLLDFVFVEIHTGERWGLFAPGDSDTWISSSGFELAR